MAPAPLVKESCGTGVLWEGSEGKRAADPWRPHMKTTTETITPAQAKEYLLLSTRSCYLWKKRVSRMAEDMRSGAWVLGEDPIRFDTEGALVDGQHRLSACVASGVPLTTLVVRGLVITYVTIDSPPRPRTARDLRCILGLPHPSPERIH